MQNTIPNGGSACTPSFGLKKTIFVLIGLMFLSWLFDAACPKIKKQTPVSNQMTFLG
jgi:hypothetical protein